MKPHAEYKKSHPKEPRLNRQFAIKPYDNYGELLNMLIECLLGFNMRLKVNPKTNHIAFSADVNSVFNIT